MADEGYWTWFSAVFSMPVNGTIANLRTLNLNAGWNLVGWTSVQQGSAANDIAPNVTAGANDDIAKWEPTTDTWTHYVFAIDPDIVLEPGRGYFVWSDISKTIDYTP